MPLNYQDRIRTLDGDMLSLEDVPEKTPIGRAYQAVLKAIEERAKVNNPYEKFHRREQQLQAMVETADIENTTPEDFARAKAELELTSRTVNKLKPEVQRLTRNQEIAGEALARLQGEHSAIVDKYQTKRHDLMTSEVDALKRQILRGYTVSESV